MMQRRSGVPSALTDGALAQRFTLDPFYVLQMALSASDEALLARWEALTGQVLADPRQVDTYPTPLGPRRLDGAVLAAVRRALVDPTARVVQEIWARPGAASAPSSQSPSIWSEGERALGWGGR